MANCIAYPAALDATSQQPRRISAAILAGFPWIESRARDRFGYFQPNQSWAKFHVGQRWKARAHEEWFIPPLGLGLGMDTVERRVPLKQDVTIAKHLIDGLSQQRGDRTFILTAI
jgi:hypothetical protein